MLMPSCHVQSCFSFNMAVSFDREANFNVEMKLLDEQLRCSICFEFFNNCMITKCSHNCNKKSHLKLPELVCSFCIRNYISYNDFCPVCYQAIAESDLRKNRQIDCLIECFKNLRLKLVEMIKTSKNFGKDGNCEKLTILSSDVDDDDEKECKKVSCPVCSIAISEKNIKLHQDNCRRNSDRNHVDVTKESSVVPSPNKRPYLSKKVYKFLKEKDLREELRKYGLNTKGNKEILSKRHKQFVIFYNSDCDSENPRPVSELVKEVEASEQRLKYECERVKTSEMKMTVNRNSSSYDIEKQRSDYLLFHRDQFSNLMHGIKSKIVDVEPSTSGINSKKCLSVTSSSGSDTRTTRSKSNVSNVAIGRISDVRKVNLLSIESSDSDDDLDDFTIFNSRKRTVPTSQRPRLSILKKK